MKTWPPPSVRPYQPRTRRCIPAFHPVPVASRQDGWTHARQAAFIGYLAETRSVLAAARRVGMGRENAYRLRKRPGAAGFAAAWDAALGKSHTPVDLASAKATGLDVAYRHHNGLLQGKWPVAGSSPCGANPTIPRFSSISRSLTAPAPGWSPRAKSHSS